MIEVGVVFHGDTDHAFFIRNEVEVKVINYLTFANLPLMGAADWSLRLYQRQSHSGTANTQMRNPIVTC